MTKHTRFKGDIGRDARTVIACSKSQAGQDLFVVALTQGKMGGRWLELGSGHPTGYNNTWLLEKFFNWNGYSMDLANPNDTQKRNSWRTLYSGVRGCFLDQPPSDWVDDPESIEQLSWPIQQQFYDLHQYEAVMNEVQDEIIPVPSRDDWKIQRPAAKVIYADATTFDYSTIEGPFDYLQVDIDCGGGAIRCLKNVMKVHRPALITYEHDFWSGTESAVYSRLTSRQLLQDLGYVMIANDVAIEPGRGFGIDGQPIFFEDWYAHPDFISTYLIETYRSVQDEPQVKYFFDILLDK